VLKVENLEFCYHNSKTKSLRNIDFKVTSGQVICLLGKSGSGKTTITRLINGVAPYIFKGESRGRISLDDHSMSRLSMNELVGVVGTVFQDPRTQFFTTDVYSELVFSCENIGLDQATIEQRVNHVVSLLGIDGLINRDLFGLSSGQKQLVALASVCTLQPKIIIFDEPSANLDHKSILKLVEIIKILKERGITILITEHRWHFLKDVIDELMIIESGVLKAKYKNQGILTIGNHQLNNSGLRSVALDQVKVVSKELVPSDVKIEVDHITFLHKKKQIIGDCTFEICGGEVVAVVGDSGIGKSTLLELVCGFKKPSKGKIRFNNHSCSSKKRMSKSYFVSQDSDYQLFTESVMDEMLLGRGSSKSVYKGACQVLKALGLWGKRMDHPATLSGGEKQRLTIGVSLMQNRELLCLDEPTSGLDYYHMLGVGRLLMQEANRGRVVLVATHDYEFIASACTSMLYLNEQTYKKIKICEENKEQILKIMNLL
jgi:energy-coupling factor transport system ATP-binding protein